MKVELEMKITQNKMIHLVFILLISALLIAQSYFLSGEDKMMLVQSNVPDVLELTFVYAFGDKGNTLYFYNLTWDLKLNKVILKYIKIPVYFYYLKSNDFISSTIFSRGDLKPQEIQELWNKIYPISFSEFAENLYYSGTTAHHIGWLDFNYLEKRQSVKKQITLQDFPKNIDRLKLSTQQNYVIELLVLLETKALALKKLDLTERQNVQAVIDSLNLIYSKSPKELKNYVDMAKDLISKNKEH